MAHASPLDGLFHAEGIRSHAPILPAKSLPRRPILLFFPLEAMMLRTPFRTRVLHLIYEIAQQELGNDIVSVTVQASADPNEPGQIGLLLTIWADVDKHQWHAADKAINKAMFEQEANWTEEERADYLRMIDFEVVPLKI